MSSTNPLSQGNRLQRAYYRWAQPRYARMALEDPGLALEIEEVDQYLYSRRGLLAWLGWFLGLIGLAVGLRAMGESWREAVALATLLWVALSLALASAWFSPKQSRSAKMSNRFVYGLLLGMAGAAIGMVAGHWIRRGGIDWEILQQAAGRTALAVVLLMPGLVMLSAVISWAGRKARQQRLQRLQLLAERDAARAAAAETELRLLQAQIHPHFVFNTLATLQHWVDRADPRAGPLLRELTGFLRGSTEMLGRSQVPLGEEVRAAAHYLAIMQARMGERLRFEIDMDPHCAGQKIPPGLLLTLVENAIEHGLEPKIEGGTLRVSSGRSHQGSSGDPGAGGANSAAGEGGESGLSGESKKAGWWLRVEDDGLGLSPQARDQVGLSNLRQRLQQHYGAQARFALEALATGGTRAELHFEEAACPAS